MNLRPQIDYMITAHRLDTIVITVVGRTVCQSSIYITDLLYSIGLLGLCICTLCFDKDVTLLIL